MKELEGLLLEDEEDCVDEFPVLEVVVDHVKRLEALRMRCERDGQLEVRSYRVCSAWRGGGASIYAGPYHRSLRPLTSPRLASTR